MLGPIERKRLREQLGDDFEYLKFLFFERVKKGAENICWLWCGFRKKPPDSYGVLCVQSVLGRKRYLFWAHRLSWEIHRGEIPEGMRVLHKCDIHACVNPGHLFLGTRGDNNADRHQKGRTAVGEQMPQHKLTAKEAQEIREKYATGSYIQQELADEYGVGRTCISQIVTFKRWKHLKRGG